MDNVWEHMNNSYPDTKFDNLLNKIEGEINIMENNIQEAIKLLRENGYIVKKITTDMKKDADKCEENGYEGDCMGCSCSICLVQ